MTALAEFEHHFAACPLVAIVRGIRPGEAAAIGRALVEAGIRIIEVPLNSPDPFTSIEQMSVELQDRALIGAGTVLYAEQVTQVAQAGGRIIVSPNSDPAVIAAAVSAGLVSAPGYQTPTEAFAALAAGAHALKLFPAEAAGPAVVKAHRAVLPPAVPLIAVGGITTEVVRAYRSAGANGFGLGDALYRPGDTPDDVHRRARAFVDTLA